MLAVLSRKSEVQRLLARQARENVPEEVRRVYARTFEEVFVYLAELDSSYPDFCRPRSQLLEGYLPDDIDLNPFIQSIETVFSVLELDLVERLLWSHTWLADFESGPDGFSSSGSLEVLRQNVASTIRIFSDFLAIVLGFQLLVDLGTVVQAKIGTNNAVDTGSVLRYIKQNPKWTTERFLALWIQDVPTGSIRDRLCKNIEAIADLKECAEWADHIRGENLLRNTRTQFLQIYGFRQRVRHARLTKERDGLSSEFVHLLDDRDNYEKLVSSMRQQQPLSLTSQSTALSNQAQELTRLKIPIQCMIDREDLETLSSNDTTNKPNQTPGDVWRSYWPKAVDAAATTHDLIWTDLLNKTDNDSLRKEMIKSSGAELYSRLSKPIHRPTDKDVMYSFEAWCRDDKKTILRVVKDLARQKERDRIKTPRKVGKEFELSADWRRRR